MIARRWTGGRGGERLRNQGRPRKRKRARFAAPRRKIGRRAPNNYRAPQAPKSRHGKIPSVSGLAGVKKRRLGPNALSFRLATAQSFRAFEQMARRRGIGGYDVARAALWRKVFGDLDPPVPSVVNWFHATRVLPCTDFSEGLLPLPDAVPRLVESLREIGLQPSPANKSSYQRDIHEEKLQWRGSWGPFGHLVRDAALSPTQNHFFRAPEAVVDLGFDRRAFRAATVPCIVKSERVIHDDVFTLAFYYAYLSTWHKKADWDCSTTWSGEGRKVPVEDIVRIEYP
jgi:hypothetical protein